MRLVSSLAILAALSLSACGGGGGGSSSANAGASSGGSGGSAEITPPSVKAENQLPTVNSDGSITAVAGRAYSFTPDVSDSDGDNLTFSLEGKPDWLSFDSATGTISGMPPESDEAVTMSMTLTITDGTGEVSFDIELLIEATPNVTSNAAPSISGTPLKATEDQAYSFAPTSSDADGDNLTFVITNKPDWLSFNTGNGALSGTPSAADIGTAENIIIMASDGRESAELAFDLTVEAKPNIAPQISGTPPSATAGQAYNFSPVFSDADNDVLSFSLTNEPNWLSVNAQSGVLSGTPDAGDIGLASDIVLIASDGTDTAQLEFNLTVLPEPNAAPLISGTPSSAVEDQAYSFTPSASDADGDNLTFAVSSKPAWLSFNTVTGRLSGTPAEADIGRYDDVTIIVSDGKSIANLVFDLVVLEEPNTAPEITGTPGEATEEVAFSFTPSASDADNDVISFSISDKPDWAAFSPMLGTLSGTPERGESGTYAGIVITASDGKDSTDLTFDLTVNAAPNRAPTITGSSSNAAQDQAYSFTPSASDLDGDDLTFALSGAPSWVSFNAATGTLSGTPDEADVGQTDNVTLTVSDGEDSAALVFSLIVDPAPNNPPTISGTPPNGRATFAYNFTPIAEDADSDSLTFSIYNKPDWAVFNTSTGALTGFPQLADVGTHSNVEITVSDGEDADSLTFAIIVDSAPNSAPEISGTPLTAMEGQAFSFTPSATDVDGDTLSFTISAKPDWLTFDSASGTISGTPQYADIAGNEAMTITVSDGEGQADLVVLLTINEDPLEYGVRTGDVSRLSDKSVVLGALTDTMEADRTQFNAARAKLFGLSEDGELTADSLTDLSWDPTHDAARLISSFGFNETVLISNDVTNTTYDVVNSGLGIVGKTDNARYMVLGSNPLRNAYRGGEVSEDMHQFMRNSLEWLTGRDNLTGAPFNVVMAQLHQNYYFPDEVANRAWLDTEYGDMVSYNDAGDCDGAALEGCLTDDTDLLIISQILNDGEDADQIADAARDAMARGIDVLYMHEDGNNGALAQTLLPVFNVTYEGDNYWRRQKITAMDITAGFGELPTDVAETSAFLTRLEADDFSFSLAECDDKSCPDGSSFYTEFTPVAKSLQDRLNDLDKAGRRIFNEAGYRYDKLIVLLGDMYRRDVSYPMDKTNTPRGVFLSSYFADHIVYNNRDNAEAQSDMGNFSRSDFSHITPENKTVSLIAKPNARSTGAYALPGQSFTVMRTDNNSDIETTVYINTLRSGATHQFNNNAYNRPKYLKSALTPLAIGESVTMTSVYGGPIQIGFSGKDQAVELSFEHVGSHPYWNGPEDDVAFSQAVALEHYDWSELVTAAFEVHSTTEKMQASLADAKWGSAAAIAAGAERYMSNLPHVLAGFKGVGIDEVDEIIDFADANSIEMQTLDVVKHMNADQANCGSGCSGNPYDAYWDYDPLGHGDIHELGHGLEKSRFRFTGWELHAVTNPYSYYSKTIYGEDTGADLDEISCQSLAFEEIFERVQASQLEVDPFAYMQANNTGGWKESVTMMVQAYMAAQAEGVLGNGWHLLARLHVIERAFSTADNSEETWLDARAGLGFDGYSRAEALAMTNDDFMLIALSHASGRDMTDFLTIWGQGSSDAAKAHVAAWGLPKMPVQFFLANDDDFCLGLDKPAVPIDGAQVWPF